MPSKPAETPEETPQIAPGAGPFEAALDEVRNRADEVWTRGPGQAPMITKHRKAKLAAGSKGRIAIVDGCRTPFVKAGEHFKNMDVVDLASVPTVELVRRLALDPGEIDLSIFGVVVPALYAPNLGREVVLRTTLPDTIPGTTVNLACASSNRAITQGAEAILAGQAEVVLAGGAESLSTVPITYSRNASQRFMEAARAKSFTAKAATLAKINPKDLAPTPPAIAEHTTGETMGESCEKMAKENGISRRAQDEIALHSHLQAAAAHAAGRFAEQIVPTYVPDFSEAVAHDTGVRENSSIEALANLRPVFDRAYGTLTAGNSSPLTDGASAVILMTESKAKALGYEPLGYIRSYAYAALDPATQLLQGPAYAAPQALDRAGLKLSDIDLVEMHEAFAAQILSNMKAFASGRFAEEELGRTAPMGEVPLDRFNVGGGSISIGHPFGATGARVTMQLLYELRRRDLKHGLMTVCAAGGSGFSMVVER
ncbi:MAG: acetyl-CoA C-acyltransferase [Holophagales bacterium]|nr:acetyl-CoA C-acyltransferase [Holophagales bacterium]